jgi:hypothetical protein
MRRRDFQSADPPPFSAPTAGRLPRLRLSPGIVGDGAAIALFAGVGPAPQGKSTKRDVDARDMLGHDEGKGDDT